ncbi:hypothetical protein ACIQ2D_08235 [Lysinibacillus sp. NPDC097287]|uniref:hypothetical protein n=1 Tax=Lysinibacillus sp. NPDC097287 TaxID=3364144 RepID=UPI003807FCE5
MGYSEIGVMLLIYSGLIIFFLVPFQRGLSIINQQKGPMTFTPVYKDNLLKLILHKKAILAFILFIFTLLLIWLNYKTADDHFNAHSGYPPISSDLQAIYSICGVIIYTVVLYLLLAFVKTFRIVKNVR